MDLASISLLVGGEGWGLLQSLPPYDAAGELRLQARLRDAGFDPALVSAALTQSRLRARAATKFGDFAGEMLFTPDGLEQATRLEVAAHHAARYLEAGVGTVFDLGCGIGADAMAFAGLDLAVRAVELDDVTAVVAGVNLRHWPDASVTPGRLEDVLLPLGDAAEHTGVWLDPARRTPGQADASGRTRRVFSLDRMQPTWQGVQALAKRVRATGVKLSPAMPHSAVPPGTEAQWTSWAGEVLECAVWWGPLARVRGRTALVARPGRPPVQLGEADAVGAPAPLTDPDGLGAWLYEPDRAVTRAGLTGALAHRVDGRELDGDVGFVTGSTALDVPWAQRYAVLDALPWNVKAVRARLRDHGVERLTAKTRGVPLDADGVRRQLRLPEGGRGIEGTLVVTRLAGTPYAVLVRPA